MNTKASGAWIGWLVPRRNQAMGFFFPGIAVVMLVFAVTRTRGDPTGQLPSTTAQSTTTTPDSIDDIPGVRHYLRIEQYGQDLDGDGIATADEGSVDVDGDGAFTEVEMEAYGLKSYICWAKPDEPMFFENIVCKATCQFVQGYGRVCVTGATDDQCVADSTGACTGTVACQFPCVCPP